MAVSAQTSLNRVGLPDLVVGNKKGVFQFQFAGGLEVGATRAELRDLKRQVTEWFQRLRTAVYAYSLQVCASPQEAEDITQEAFLRLYSYLTDGHRVENARAWLYRVAHNLAVNEVKSQSRAALCSVRAREVASALPDPSCNPEQLVLRQERRGRLWLGMGALTQQQRQCIRLRAEGYRYREIADSLGISEVEVANGLRCAVKKLGLNNRSSPRGLLPMS